MSIKISEYKTYLWDYLNNYHNVTNPKQFFQCLNPEHTDNNPSMMFTSKYNICKCFSCGVSYDIFDLIGIDYNINNFKEQINKLQELYFGYVPDKKTEYHPTDNKKYDYTYYFKKCKKNISKSIYLQSRGITFDLIEKYNIGFDEERELIVFPINKHCYFARSTINGDKIKSKGSSDIWNKKLLLENDSSIIYVTESIIDSLSLETIDPNVKTISINGIGNINSLVYELKNNNFKGLIVISFDNDYSGIGASEKLKKELADLNVSSFSNTLINNFGADKCKDLNEALIENKELLKNNYEYFNTYYLKYLEEKNKKESSGEYVQ